jgi:hypothetical protein
MHVEMLFEGAARRMTVRATQLIGASAVMRRHSFDWSWLIDSAQHIAAGLCLVMHVQVVQQAPAAALAALHPFPLAQALTIMHTMYG